jgi:AcrR family transcriptional regulator
MSESSVPSRSLRSDAQRNRERLLNAARELFAWRGADVPLETIAQRAGVSIGTLYNRFPTRQRLIEAVFIDRLEQIVSLARAALADQDPWRGFADCLTAVCELQAADRGFNEVAARGLAQSSEVERLHRAGRVAMTDLVQRAQQAGVLRGDVTVEDLAFVVWGISRTVQMTGDTAPRLWRRHLGLLLDGFRAEGARPLPEPPRPPA